MGVLLLSKAPGAPCSCAPMHLAERGLVLPLDSLA